MAIAYITQKLIRYKKVLMSIGKALNALDLGRSPLGTTTISAHVFALLL